MAESPRTRTSGIDRSLQLLDVLTETGRAMSAYELGKAAGAPVSTVYRLVDELVEREMLSRHENGLIWLGPRLMRYGLQYRASIDFYAEARREMRHLAEVTGETVQLCARDGNMMAVIAMVEGPGHFRVTSDVGTRVPLNWTASGRLLLGHLPENERIAAFTEAARPSATGKADTDAAQLARQSHEDFARRLAIQIGQSEFAVACIAAPIRNESGACAATISIVLAERQAEKRGEELAKAVQDSALRIERAVGYVEGAA
ncbi:IclR family transcriptional regulator [Paracoccus sp. MBLB3053]|uniref:IclR family transcriptional regulator n=1 Tax=Paracoccus aurantius TaxID=3073814 RepID=A0ABU2HXW0_9RHOB|nr:IclR family transcriptional regulator [Paracoccus sp. MBLB3053]MDS9469350.1 IclR family transcriptional regulator [Paracoccus sp. MBLB3053]